MPSRRRRPTVEEELAAFDDATRDPTSTGGVDALHHALATGHPLIVARAARLLDRRRQSGFEVELSRAFLRVLGEPAKKDPGCRAKSALLDALDHFESADATPFFAGAACVQQEPAYGAPVDTAAGVRARAIVALARIGVEDFPLWAGQLIGDPASSVRVAALDALAHRGDRAGGGIALAKLRAKDEDPIVDLAALRALLTLAPEWGLREARAKLLDLDENQRELAAMALGESQREDALDLLLEALDRTVDPGEKANLLRAVEVSRLPRARERLRPPDDTSASDAHEA